MATGRAALFIEEPLVEEASDPLRFMWGHQIAFGWPLRDEGAIIDALARRCIVHEAMQVYEPRRHQPGADGRWPHTLAVDGSLTDASRVPVGEEQAVEMACMTDLPDGWFAITNPARRVGFGVHFDPAVFGYLWYWQQLGDIALGIPW